MNVQVLGGSSQELAVTQPARAAVEQWCRPVFIYKTNKRQKFIFSRFWRWEVEIRGQPSQLLGRAVIMGGWLFLEGH